MARISDRKAGGKNVKFVLDTIAYAEGTSTSRYTKDDGYDVIVNGVGGEPKTFDDYSKHPGVLVQVRKDLKSTAAGRYQNLKRYADQYMIILGLKDFGPESQDLIAIRILKEQGAYEDAVAGRFTQAIEKVSNIWASLPNSPYGQRGAHAYNMADLQAYYVKAGGEVAA